MLINERKIERDLANLLKEEEDMPRNLVLNFYADEFYSNFRAELTYRPGVRSIHTCFFVDVFKSIETLSRDLSREKKMAELKLHTSQPAGRCI